MQHIRQLIGTAYDAAVVARAIKEYVRGMDAPVVGAMHVTCSDGAEHECADAFHQELVQDLLPAYTFLNKAAFRTANLGARYEWNSVRVAESHFAGAAPGHAYKLMVVKINTHVAWDTSDTGPVFGRMRRFDAESTYCGALHSLIDGRRGPFLDLLREVYSSEGIDRLAMLRDPRKVAPEHQALVAAVIAARLQARQALLDIQDYTPVSPTVYLVLACVSLNRLERDHEMVCGYYLADFRQGKHDLEYMGLGDDPSRYVVEASDTSVTVLDQESRASRPAYDYRGIIGTRWKSLRDGAIPADAFRADLEPRVALLQFLTTTRADAPRAGALLAFACGLSPIYHLHRAFRVSQDAAFPGDAAMILDEAMARVGELSERELGEAWHSLRDLLGA